MSSTKSKRLHILEILLLVATVLVIGFVGYAVYQANKNDSIDIATQEEEQVRADEEGEIAIDDDIAATLPEVPQVNSINDLDKALLTLEDMSLEAAYHDYELTQIEREE